MGVNGLLGQSVNMFRAEDTTQLGRTELQSRIRGARNLVIGLWVIGIVNLAIVVGLVLQGESGSSRIMGFAVGVAAIAAGIRLSGQRKVYVSALAERSANGPGEGVDVM